MSERSDRANDAREYLQAISQWQLAARTEVKMSSSLPSSMFDTRDPMLEACLADSVEAMMHCLHEPAAAALEEQAKEQEVELRVEKVSQEELRQLPTLIPAEQSKLDLESGVSAEYLSLLIDTCTTGDETTQAAARDLLLRDFEVEANADLEQATQAIFECMQRVLADGPCGDEAQRRTVELCSAIAASIIMESNHPRDDS